jgi:tetratricopeptide (TPR) repeat protein
MTAPRRWLYLTPLLGLALGGALLAGTSGYAQQSLRQGDGARASADYALAGSAYRRALSVAAAPVLGWPLADTARRARLGLAKNDLEWGQALTASGKYPEARGRLTAALSESQTAHERAFAREAMASLLLDWASTLQTGGAFTDAIDRLHQVLSFDPAGVHAGEVRTALARAYLGEAARLDASKQYAEALPWYRDVVRQFDGTEQATAARAGIPHVLYEQALVDVKASLFEQARSAMNATIRDYPDSQAAASARAALAANQPLTGRTVGPDHSPVPNIQVRVVTQWKILRPGVYDDSLGQAYLGTSDAEGRFSIALPPGNNYLVTWWSPSRNSFMTTFTPDFSDSANKLDVRPLQPASAGDLPVS